MGVVVPEKRLVAMVVVAAVEEMDWEQLVVLVLKVATVGMLLILVELEEELAEVELLKRARRMGELLLELVGMEKQIIYQVLKSHMLAVEVVGRV